MNWLRFANPAAITHEDPAETSYVHGRRCIWCEQKLTLSLPRLREHLTVEEAKRVGVRCTECFKTFCTECAYKHFGKRQPKWMKQPGSMLWVKAWGG